MGPMIQSVRALSVPIRARSSISMLTEPPIAAEHIAPTGVCASQAPILRAATHRMLSGLRYERVADRNDDYKGSTFKHSTAVKDRSCRAALRAGCGTQS